MPRVWYRWNLSNLGCQDSYPRLPVSSALETLQATVNYSNLPHSQDNLARKNENAIVHQRLKCKCGWASEGEDEQRSLNKDKLFIRKVADIISKVCGNLKHFSRGHGESESHISVSITSMACSFSRAKQS